LKARREETAALGRRWERSDEKEPKAGELEEEESNLGARSLFPRPPPGLKLRTVWSPCCIPILNALKEIDCLQTSPNRWMKLIKNWFSGGAESIQREEEKDRKLKKDWIGFWG